MNTGNLVFMCSLHFIKVNFYYLSSNLRNTVEEEEEEGTNQLKSYLSNIQKKTKEISLICSNSGICYKALV